MEVRLLGMGITGGDGGGRDVEMGAGDALTWLSVAFSRLMRAGVWPSMPPHLISFRRFALCDRLVSRWPFRAPSLPRHIKVKHHVFSFSFIPSPVNMAPAVRRPTGQAVQAEVSLLQSLKNCLVNLPSSLVSILVNANTVRMKPSYDA